MTIRLLQSVRINGSVVSAGPALLNYSAALEADLVRRGVAEFVGPKVAVPEASGSVITSSRYDEIAAAVVAGTFSPAPRLEYVVSDGPLAGRVLEWNGESFGGFAVQPIAQSFAPATRSSANVAGDATEAVVAAVTLPGYLMRPNSKLRVVSDWAFTNSVSTKILGVRFGPGGGVAGPTFTTSASAKVLTEIANANSYLAQKIQNNISYGNTPNAIVDRAVDTRAPFVVEFTTRWNAAVASESITLIGYSIELQP